jgi:hypothetical protein
MADGGEQRPEGERRTTTKGVDYDQEGGVEEDNTTAGQLAPAAAPPPSWPSALPAPLTVDGGLLLPPDHDRG